MSIELQVCDNKQMQLGIMKLSRENFDKYITLSEISDSWNDKYCVTIIDHSVDNKIDITKIIDFIVGIIGCHDTLVEISEDEMISVLSFIDMYCKNIEDIKKMLTKNKGKYMSEIRYIDRLINKCILTDSKMASLNKIFFVKKVIKVVSKHVFYYNDVHDFYNDLLFMYDVCAEYVMLNNVIIPDDMETIGSLYLRLVCD